MIVNLYRFSYSETETEGILRVGGLSLATIEQPWRPNPSGAPGGKPFESCVPDGMYRLKYFKRPNGDDAFIFYNPELGVYRYADDHEPGEGRHLCLIHKANWAHEVQGCVAPGMRRQPMEFGFDEVRQAVRQSGQAMFRLFGQLKYGPHILNITNAAKNGAK